MKEEPQHLGVSHHTETRIEPFNNTVWWRIAEWCRHYEKNNRYPIPVLQRYGVGIYQIHQGMEWPDLLNKAESYMSSFLHFQMVQEQLQLPWWDFAKIEDLTELESHPMLAERVVYLISKIQQQIFYSTRAGKTQRGSRFKPEVTCMRLVELQTHLIKLVPTHLRADGLYHASKIMSGTL